VLLFKGGKLAEAKAKIWQTFCANTYVLDKFFGHPIHPIQKDEWSNLAQAGFTAYFTYSHQQPELFDFSQWLGEFMTSELFTTRKARYLTIHLQLLVEEDQEIRAYLRQEAHQLEKAIKF
jgi:hypothetical protein